MKKTKIKHDEDLNFWQPTSDLMSGLMYMLMLVILLLGLHLMQLPEYHELDPNLGDSVYCSDRRNDLRKLAIPRRSPNRCSTVSLFFAMRLAGQIPILRT